MSIDDLLVIRNEYGYTREECKILDECIKATWFDSVEEYENLKDDHTEWIGKTFPDLELCGILKTINERVVIMYR